MKSKHEQLTETSREFELDEESLDFVAGGEGMGLDPNGRAR